MTDSSSLPEPSQPSQPVPPTQEPRPILSFDERVAVIVAFSTIGLILFWSWGGRKIDLFSQTEQIFKSAAKQTEALQADAAKSFDIRGSINGLEDKTEVAILPDTEALSATADDLSAPELAGSQDKKEKTAPSGSLLPLIALPSLSGIGDSITNIETSTIPKIETPTIPKIETPKVPKIKTPDRTTQSTPIVTFDDVPLNHWAYPFIEPLIEEKLIVGISDKEFQPDLPITREQLAVEINTAFQTQKSRDIISFGDIARERKTSQKINEAVTRGFLKGYPGEVFRPDQKVPRLQVLVALVSGLELRASKDPTSILNAYQDKDQIPDWAKEKIAIAIESGLVVNRPGFDTKRLYPNEFATRAEVVAMIYQGLAKTGQRKPVSSPYIVPSP